MMNRVKTEKHDIWHNIAKHIIRRFFLQRSIQSFRSVNHCVVKPI